MPLPVIADVFRCAFTWANAPNGSHAVNVMHFHAPGKDESDVFSALDSNVGTDMWAHTLTSIGISTVDVTKLDGSSASVQFTTGLTTDWKGGQGASNIVPQVSVLVKLRTAERGRSKRGRVFLPWPSEASVGDGLLASALVSPMNAAWSSFVSSMNGDGVTFVVASYVDTSATDVVSALVESNLGTQRRRQPR